MNRLSSLTVALCLVGTIVSAGDSLIAQSVSAPKEIGLSGSVLGPDNAPVEGAEVRFLVKDLRFGTASSESNGSIVGKTDGAGRFSLRFSAVDPRVARGSHTTALLLISAPDLPLHTERFALTRCLSDAPLQIRLKPASPVSVRVQDAAGNPKAGVRVRPAVIGETTLPFDDGEHLAQQADSSGIARFSCATRGQLKKVYVDAPELGKQCLPVTAVGGELVATTLETTVLRGQVVAQSSGLNGPPALDEIELQFSSSVGDLQAYSWSRARVGEDGTFRSGPMAAGRVTFGSSLPEDFPYTFDYSIGYRGLTMTGEPMELELHPATLVRGRVIDGETGEGIPDIFIDHFDRDGRLTMTGADGRFSFWAGPNRISYYPSHSLGKYTFSGGFYLVPQQLPVDGQLQLEPVQMRRMSTAVGRVVDAAGNPQSGITVECMTKIERFTQTVKLSSDRSGEFRFYGVSDGTAISLSAKTENLGTKRPLSLLLASDARPVLSLEELPVAYFTGQVVDERGAPVVGAAVTVRRASVSQEESYGGEDRSPEPLFPSESVVTDSNGRFKTPVTTEFHQDTSLSISAAGFQLFNTGWKKRSPARQEERQIDLGALPLIDKPEVVALQVKIVSADSGQPVDGARVAFLGAKSGLVKKHLGDQNHATFRILDTPQLVAAAADGYVPSIRGMDSFPDKMMEIRLSRELTARRVPVRLTKDALVGSAERLLALVPEPLPTATYYKMMMYYPCLGLTDPAAVVDRLKVMKLAGADLSVLQAVVSDLVRMPEQEIRRTIPIAGDQVKVYLYSSLAEKAKSEAEREELLSEALISARQLTGDPQLYAYSHLACAMLKLGMNGLAIEILREAWDAHAEIQQIVDDGKRLERGDRKQGIARFFAPPLALVDRRVAMKLIDLTAYADEVQVLRSQALAFLAGEDAAGWEAAVDAFAGDQLKARGIEWYCDKVGFTNLKSGTILAQRLTPSIGKAKFLFHLAEQATDDRGQRIELARRALSTLRLPFSEPSADHPSQVAASGCLLVKDWDERLAAQLAFESIWLCEHENRILPFNLTCELARRLASYDQEMARTLVGPCFEDWSWLFGARDDAVIYQRNQPLIAAASIDPDWAVSKTRELFETELASQPSRRLATLHGIISRWTEIADEMAPE